MKKINSPILSLFVLLISSCASRNTIPATAMNPAADAEIEVGRGPNNNTSAHLKVKHMALPQSLNPDLRVYSVWTRAKNSPDWQNAGQMEVGKSREVDFKIVTPHKNFDLLVTGETNGTVEYPSEYVVLRKLGLKRK